MECACSFSEATAEREALLTCSIADKTSTYFKTLNDHSFSLSLCLVAGGEHRERKSYGENIGKK